MVSLSLKLKRRQWTISQLLVIALIVAVLLSSLSLFHAVISSECSSHFVDTGFATHLPPSLLSSSPAVVSTSLAFKQSYGLFNDIPDQRWELMRKGAHEVHGHILKNPSCKPKVETDSSILPIIEYLSNQEVSEEESKH
jgi:hypothetical protein